MDAHAYATLVRYKQWADRDLHAVVAQNLDRLDAQDARIVLRVLDHIHVVDRIFQHHLQGLPHAFQAPRSEALPDLRKLRDEAKAVDDWYADYVARGSIDFDEPVEFAFTNGAPARMTRGQIILHVCLHGTYHRGNVGILLQKRGIAPNQDRMTDFLEQAA